MKRESLTVKKSSPHSPNKKLPSLSSLRKLLQSVQFNPRKPGPMKLISETDSPEYLELRAIECIRSAKQVRKDWDNVGTRTQKGFEQMQEAYDRHMLMATRLLTLARHYGSL